MVGRRGTLKLYRGAEYVVDFLPKVKLEVAIGDNLLDQTLEAITRTANTGKIGDGKNICNRPVANHSYSYWGDW